MDPDREEDDGQTKDQKERPPPSCVSLKSDHSAYRPIYFKEGSSSDDHIPPPSCVSLKSDHSAYRPIYFKEGSSSDDHIVDQESSDVPIGPSAQLHQTHLDSEFKKDEPKSQCESVKQEDLADLQQSKTNAPACQRELKSNLKQRFQCVFEGIAKAGTPTLLNQIYTELFITEGGTGEVNKEHEVRQIENASRQTHREETTIKPEDIFKPLTGREEPVNKVLTKGVAGIGKTVLTQKFTLDWAEDKHNQDIEFMFPFTFRELNVLRERKFSLVELVHHVFHETKSAGIYNFEEFQVVFILDGLDECRLPLDFTKTETLTDVRESTSLHVLLVNLIRGKLLPSARLWITTRPAAANQIPADCVDTVTDVRGFNDSQKEEYIRKRFRDKKQASRIISHIKTSRSLYIMCHIPVFCWITATVLENLLKTREVGELPNTLTAMFIHFLVVQAKLKNVKYDGGAEAGPHWSPETIQIIESLGKLAFEQLQKPDGNLIFYESDLSECGIDITEASVYSGVFTQIFREEESGLFQDKVFYFIHLSVQEFLAALHVRLTFNNYGVNLMTEEKPRFHTSAETHFRESAVDEASESPNGHLDLFLRFFLGLSLPTNQNLLSGLLKQTRISSGTNQETADYIKRTMNRDLSAERSINLFHCLNELNEYSLVSEIQMALRFGNLSPDRLSPAQWSALAFILLSSEKDLDVFDLKKYAGSEGVLLRLMPLVKVSNKARLSGCYLSGRSCAALSSVLSSQSSSLTELDLSNNNLQDSGVERLCVGLKSPGCKLETLSLSGCLITERGCVSLASALTSDLSHLRELDLSYNHPGASGERLMKAALDDPQCTLTTLRTVPAGEQWMTPGLRKYSCALTIDTNTVNRTLKLSENNKNVTAVWGQKQPYPDHPDRFDLMPQLLCRETLPDRCYWEVEFRGKVNLAVSYRGINRKDIRNCMFGQNVQSWSLTCSRVENYHINDENDSGDDDDDEECYSLWHNMRETRIQSSPHSDRLAVYVDRSAGTLSFYELYSDSLQHIHTLHTTFTDELYAGFMVGHWSNLRLV